jgi:hypothetical protein
LDSIFEVVATYGEDMLACGETPARPVSRLRHSKTEIEAAILQLLDVLGSSDGQAIVRGRYGPEFARHVATPDYQANLRNALLCLSEFVSDEDAALCHWEWTLLQEADRTGDLLPTLDISPEQYERIRQVRLAISAEKADLQRRLRARFACISPREMGPTETRTAPKPVEGIVEVGPPATRRLEDSGPESPGAGPGPAVPRWGWLAGCVIAAVCLELNRTGFEGFSMIAAVTLTRLVVGRHVRGDEQYKWVASTMIALVGSLVYYVLSGRWAQQ